MIWPIAFLRPFAYCRDTQDLLDRVIASSVTRPAVSHQSFGHHANSCRLSALINDYRSKKTKPSPPLYATTIIYYWARSAGF